MKNILTLLCIAGAVHALDPRIGHSCRSDDECLENGWEVCAMTTRFEGICEHKALFPMKELEFWGMVTVFVILWTANMGGVGGGGMVVPICITFFRFDIKNSIALSNFSIFLSALVRYILCMPVPHPLKNGKGLIVDLNLGIIMLPLIISGVSFGGILNLIMPQMIIIAFYILLLGYIG